MPFAAYIAPPFATTHENKHRLAGASCAVHGLTLRDACASQVNETVWAYVPSSGKFSGTSVLYLNQIYSRTRAAFQALR